MESVSGITEFSIFNIIESSDKTGYQYFKSYAEEIINNINDYNSITPDMRVPFEFQYSKFFDFSSVAYHENGTDKIEISDGVLITTFQVMYSIFSEFSIFSFLDDSTSGSLGVKFVYEFENNQQYEMSLQYPINLNRRILAEYAASIAIKFVILHEIAHHYDGHISYLNKSNSNTNMSISKLDFQTMEMDADAFAISRLIDEMLVLLKTDTRLCSIIMKVEDLFSIFSYAISLLFLMINNEYDKEINDIDEDHLSTLIRLTTCLDCAKVNLKYKAQGIITDFEFEEIYKESMLSSNYHYSLFGKTHRDDAKKCSEDTLEYINKLHKNWIELRVKLLPYARHSLAEN